MSPSAYDTWMVSLREDEDVELPSIGEQEAILDFLNQKTTAEEASSAYTRVVASAKYPNPDGIWLLLWRTAGKWPETHARLVELLTAISKLPPLSEDSKEDYWSDLPEFGFGLREYCAGKQTKVILNKDPEIHAAFVNLTAFNAHLLREDVFDLELWALMMLNDALDESWEGKIQVLDTFVSAAAQYILQAGSAVYRCDKGERWGFWKERFALVGALVDLQSGTRTLAKQAFEAMERTEKESH